MKNNNKTEREMKDFDIDNFFHAAGSSPQGPISPGQKKVPITWEFKDGSKEDIDHVEPGCWCTEPPVITDKGITVYYNNSTDESNVRALPSKRKSITKTVTVYLKDGKPLKVKQGMAGEAFNTEKTKISLFFSVVVEV